MRFSSKSVEHICIHVFLGVFFVKKTFFRFRPSEASFFLGDVSCLMAVGKSKMAVGKSQMVLGKSQRAATTAAATHDHQGPVLVPSPPAPRNEISRSGEPLPPTEFGVSNNHFGLSKNFEVKHITQEKLASDGLT